MQIETLTNASVLFELERNNFEDFYSLSGCKEELSNALKHYFVAKIDDECVGYVGILVVENQAELLRIAVNKEHRQKGIGDKLLNFILNFLQKSEILEIFLEVSEKNTNAIRFYEKNNFKHIYTRKNYYGEGNSALIMQRSV